MASNLYKRYFRTLPKLTRSVIVVGYPKSGNTWLTRMVGDLIGCPVIGFWGQPHNDEIAKQTGNHFSRYRVYKAHQGYGKLKKIGPIHRIIHIVRDPRDVACSGAHFFNHRRFCREYGVDVSPHAAMVQTVLEGSMYPQCKISWGKHFNTYNSAPRHMVRYEDLISDGLRELGRIANHVGIDRTEGQIKSVLEANSFEPAKRKAMSENPEKGQKYFRKGKVGSFVDELETNLISQIDLAFEREMLQLGYLERSNSSN